MKPCFALNKTVFATEKPFFPLNKTVFAAEKPFFALNKTVFATKKPFFASVFAAKKAFFVYERTLPPFQVMTGELHQEFYVYSNAGGLCAHSARSEM